jgi:Bacterial pre-peptidase C-terminal domain
MAADIGSSTSNYGAASFTTQGFGSKIDFAGDHDWFRARLQSRSTYTIEVKSRGDGGLNDPFLTLRNANGVSIADDDDSGAGLNAKIVFKPSTDGFYYLDVSGAGNSVGNYVVTVKEQPAPGDAPSGPQTNYRVNVGGNVSGSLPGPADNDWYRVKLTKGKSYNFDLTRTSGNIDPVLLLRDPSQKLLATDDDGGGFPNSRIANFKAAKTGDYFLIAQSYQAGSSGNYQLSASSA